MQEFIDAIAEMTSAITKIHDRLAAMEGYHERNHRPGPVTDVDAKKHAIRLQVGVDENGQPVKSPWQPYSQIAGNRKHHSVPSVGQQGMLHSPNGDFEQAYFLPLTWSTQIPSPSNDPDKDVDQRTDPNNPAKRSVWWQKAGDVQQQVVKSSWHVTSGNAHHRVGDSRDGTDSLQQETSPQQQKASDTVHYHDIDTAGGNGITHSVNNDKHKVSLHPTKGFQFGVNFEQTQQSTPGPGTDTSSTHKTVYDFVKGILHSVMGGDHTISVDPATGITHTTLKSIVHNAIQNISHTAGQAISRSAGTSITDTATQIGHDGNTNVQGTLGVSQLLSLAGGLSSGALEVAKDADGGLTHATMGFRTTGDALFDGAVNATTGGGASTGIAAGAMQDGAAAENVGTLGGVLAGTLPNPSFASQTMNFVCAAPNGSNGAATFRALVAADVTGLAPSATTDATNAANITSGVLPLARLAGFGALVSYANDAAAAAGAVAVGGLYRNGSILMTRVV